MKLITGACLLIYFSSVESFQSPDRAVMLRTGGSRKGLVELRCDVSETDKKFVVHEADDNYSPQHRVENVWWSFDGPIISGMPCGLESMCLSCRNSVENCNIDGVHCAMLKNERWFVKVDPNQTKKGPSGQLYFSIYSDLFPTRCITHDKNLNRFRLDLCQSPPTEAQSFFIDPDYFSLVQKSQVFVAQYQRTAAGNSSATP